MSGKGFRFLLAVNLLWLASALAEDEIRPVPPPDTLPVVVLPERSGQYIRLQDFAYPGAEKPRKPRSVVVLNFMATWCRPCQKELPWFLETVRGFKDQPVRAFLISRDKLSDRAQLDALCEEQGIDVPVLLDPYGVAANRFGVGSIPRSFVFSPEGRLTLWIEGAVTNYHEQLVSGIRRALGAPEENVLGKKLLEHGSDGAKDGP